MFAEAVDEHDSRLAGSAGHCVRAEHPQASSSAAKVVSQIRSVTAIELRGKAAAACEWKRGSVNDVVGVGEEGERDGNQQNQESKQNLIELHNERYLNTAKRSKNH